MPKISLNAGHTPKAPGASGHLDEVTEDRKIRAALDKYLKAAGWTTHDSTTDEATSRADINTIVSRANASGADYLVSIHLNSGGGTGVEVIYAATSNSQWVRGMAAKVSAALASLLGLRDRGAKPDTATAAKSLGVLRNTAMPAILVETCFVDSAADAAAYRRVGPDAIGKCIAECIAGTAIAGSAGAPAPSKPAGKKAMNVDGDWGTTTTIFLQEAFGTAVDGEVWHQWAPNRQAAFVAGWKYDNGGAGSPLVKAMQRWLGVDDDGIWGKKTTKALQGKMGTKVDGELWRHSPCVKEMQRRLNAGTLV